MKTYRGVSVIGTVLLVLGTAVGSAPAAEPAAEPALNILVYGNSFVNNLGLPYMFANIAQGLGHPRPNMVNASVNSKDLAFHIAVQTSNTPVVPNKVVKHWIDDNSLNKNCSGKWDYVIMHEYSSRPTNITYASLGNPTAFKADAKKLYQLVAANSPKVTPILMETWARQPGKTADLEHFYPGLAPLAAANKMQAELHQYYTEARAGIGNSITGLASVGDAFQAMGFSAKLYNSDLYHDGYQGQMLACFTLYNTIYHTTVSQYSYEYMNTHMGSDNFTQWKVTREEWTAMAAAADAAASPATARKPRP
jgi:hypothetical protein